jgi:hypothetical protein
MQTRRDAALVALVLGVAADDARAMLDAERSRTARALTIDPSGAHAPEVGVAFGRAARVRELDIFGDASFDAARGGSRLETGSIAARRHQRGAGRRACRIAGGLATAVVRATTAARADDSGEQQREHAAHRASLVAIAHGKAGHIPFGSGFMH